MYRYLGVQIVILRSVTFLQEKYENYAGEEI
jgi:hypothetical protein